MKNFADQGGCYPLRPKAEVDNTEKERENEFFVFLLTKNNTTSSPGFLGHQFKTLQRAALLTLLVQYDKVLSKFS